MNGCNARRRASFMPQPERPSERSEQMRISNWIAGAPLAALLLSATPAQAQERWSDPAFMAAANVTVHRGPQAIMAVSGVPHRGDGRHDGDRRHDGRHRGAFDDGLVAGGWGWFDPNLNRSWDSDSYNDWWHDRPDRAYPRWVQHNDGCDEGRMWQGGGAWRCSW
jgi:hypothetical protein